MTPSMLWRTQARFSPQDSLRFLQFGDSFASYGMPVSQMWAKYGWGGFFDPIPSSLTYAGGAYQLDASEGATIYPANTMTCLPLGASVTFYGSGAAGQVRPCSGSILKIYYRAKAGGGSFKVQTEENLSGVWSDVPGYTSVSTDNGGDAVPAALNIQLPAPGYFRIKLTSIAGTCAVLFANVMEKSTVNLGGTRQGGACFMHFDQGGAVPLSWLASKANWAAILTDYDPHIISISSLESLENWQASLPETIACLRAAAPNADIVIVGNPPAAVGDNDIYTPTPVDEYLKGFCHDNHLLFVYLREHFPPYDTAPEGYYAGPPHLGGIGIKLAQRIVWQHLDPLLDIDGSWSPFGSSPALLAAQRVSDFRVVNPQGESSPTTFALCSGKGTPANYNQRVFGVNPNLGGNPGAWFWKSPDGSISKMGWPDNTWRFGHGGYNSGTTPAPVACHEFYGNAHWRAAAAVSVDAAHIANVFEIRKGGQLIFAIDKDGNIVPK